ncbi:hypothetical protein LPJ66_008384, partial [Kickxella alabastrina]
MAKISRPPTCIAVQCPACSEFVEFDLPKGDEAALCDVTCYKCKRDFPMDVKDVPFWKASEPSDKSRGVPSPASAESEKKSSSSSSPPPRPKRKDGKTKGTDEEPLETEYY